MCASITPDTGQDTPRPEAGDTFRRHLLGVDKHPHIGDMNMHGFEFLENKQMLGIYLLNPTANLCANQKGP